MSEFSKTRTHLCNSEIFQEFNEQLKALHSEYHQPVMMYDEGDGFKQNSILCVGVLDLLGLGWLLGFVEDGLQTLCQTTTQRCILYNNKDYVLRTS